jgi:hypothetical protein
VKELTECLDVGCVERSCMDRSFVCLKTLISVIGVNRRNKLMVSHWANVAHEEYEQRKARKLERINATS